MGSVPSVSSYLFRLFGVYYVVEVALKKRLEAMEYDILLINNSASQEIISMPTSLLISY